MDLKERLRDFLLTVAPVAQCLLIALVAFLFAVLPVAFVIAHLKLLRWLWLPLLLLYWLFLSVVAWQLIRRREMLAERFLYGDELFFQLYPHFKRVEERKKRRRARWEKLLSHIREGY